MGKENVKDMDTYNKFRSEAENAIRNIERLKKELSRVNRLADDAYMKETEIPRNLSFDERIYQKLVWQIKEKQLEIRIMELESSIEGTESYLHMQILYLAKMEDRIGTANFSHQLNDTKMTKSINDNYANMNITLEENDLYVMQMRLLSMQADRGEIAVEMKVKKQAELKENIEDNKDYVESLKEELVKERAKQLGKQVAFKFNQGKISTLERDALISRIQKIDEYKRSYTLEDMLRDYVDNSDTKFMSNPKK